MPSTPEHPRPPARHRSPVEAFEDTRAVVELLARHRLVAAPHVAARLGLALGGDADAIIEVAGLLRESQRLGHAVLPDPLPSVPAIEVAMASGGARLAAWERNLLIVAAVCVDDRIDVLLAASGRPMAELIDGEVSRHLLLVAGHFAFADPRMRVWVHGAATLAERTAAHAALAEACTVLGDERQAVWHRSLATLEGSRELVAPLLEIAESADAAGESEWAHAVAREAASHAYGAEAVTAWSLAGRAALHGGHVDDARTWLDRVLEHGDETARTAVLADYLTARAGLEGDVPEVELDDRLAALAGATTPSSPSGDAALHRLRLHLARALATAAGLLAERGAMAAARHRLDQARAITDAWGLDRASLESGTAWCALFGLETDAAAGPDGGPLAASTGAIKVIGGARAVAAALERGLAGDPAGAVRWLGAVREVPGDPTLTREDRSPLMRAARAVTTSLLELWSGDVRRAAQALARGAADLPVALPLSGLGAALARRIDIIATGEVSAFARAIEAARPPTAGAVRSEELIDRAITAHLAGARSEASALVALAAEFDRGCGGLHVPGLDAAVDWSPSDARDARDTFDACDRSGAEFAPVRRPPDAVLASELRRRMRSTDRQRFDADYLAAVEGGRAIASAYERARTELMLARACREAGAPDRAARHLLAAEHLFGDAGADAWLAAVADERRLLEATATATATAHASATASVGVGGRPSHGEFTALAVSPVDRAAPAPAAAHPSGVDDPLAACRAAWADVLTERELEVAMLVVEGASNRDAAGRLYVSVRTVEVHVGRVFQKLDVHSRVELAVLAHRMAHAAQALR
ncbi:helix-turn-helix transcriptional regulator [Agromyces endophyticus]|uniref:helix-turn-helix domain-containing protein n=1 Tax=Agromyces sp. H17E-10 TaxID=2932244 RepID=UPI001FD096C9|nr:helix-turn-helix transcriptional regulator [Agromyces sp. H17E-10]UOQ88392.1 helix-turn-helix transcriptional regulator [Agromyces sp. H17E-10]